MSNNLKSADGLPTTGYLRQPQLLEIVPVSPATLWRWVKSGRIVAPVKLSERVTAWKVESIREWLATQTVRAGG